MITTNLSFSQNCTSFFGQSGVPAGGIDYFLCTVPGSTLLDATNTQGNPSAYSWSTGANTPTITVTGTGIYTVTVGSPQHPDACVINFSVQLTNPMQPGLGNDTAICFGDTLNLGSDFQYDTYSWSTGDTTDTLLASAPGTYMLTVADNNGCTASDTITISNNPLPSFSLTDDTICTYDSLIIIPSNTNYNSYLWSTGETSTTITSNVTGTYQLTVTDTNNCSSVDSMTLYNYPQATTNLGLDYSICPEDTTTLTPGVNYSSYLWSNNSNSNSIDINISGTYWVETADLNGCISSDTININTYNVTHPFLGNDTSICEYGDTITLDAGLGYVNYSWSNSATTQTINVLGSGTFQVTVSDLNGCIASDTILITQYPSINATTNSFQACVGDTMVLEVSSGYASYIWSNGDTSNTAQTTISGNYIVTVTDSNTCESEFSILASNFSTPTPNLGADDTLCYGITKTVDAGIGYVSYLWSTGSQTQTETFDTSGIYWVEVTDTNGCTGRDTINLLFEFGPTFSLNNDTSICEFDSIILAPNLTGNSYLWNTNETSQTINVTSPGQYNLSITGSNGCTSSDSVTISNYSLPVVDLGNEIYYCQNTTFNQTVDAGAGFTIYQWMNGSSSQTIQADQSMDTIWVNVTDINSCQNSDTILVVENPLPTLNMGPDDTICSGQNRVINSSANTNSVTSYNWNTNDTTGAILYTAPQNLTNILITDFSVTITDTNGCVNSDSIIITVLPLPDPNLGNDTSYCVGDGFTHTLNPGNFNSYIWSTGVTTQTIQIGSFDSVYSVTVTNAIGCQNTDYIFITEHQLPSPRLGSDTSYCEGVDFAHVLNPGGYQSYIWTTGNTQPHQLVTSSGSFGVTVTDANGCENYDSITITMNPKPMVDLGGNITLCDDSLFSYVLNASSQLPTTTGYNFEWNTGSILSSVYVTEFGTYSVTVTDDATFCSDSSSVELIPFNAVELELGNDTLICDNSAQVLTPDVSVSTGYTYTWSTGATTPTIQVSEPGTYWVELNATNGTCMGISDTINYELAFMPQLELGPAILSCLNDPVVLKNTLDNNDTVTYIWQDTLQFDSIITLQEGYYRVTAFNECGTITDEVHVSFIDCYQFYIPTAFTPNEDNLNDLFKPETSQELTEYHFQIFNRWGELVFETTDIDAAWNGTLNGTLAPNDVYVWKLSYVSAYDPFQERREEIGKVVLHR